MKTHNSIRRCLIVALVSAAIGGTTLVAHLTAGHTAGDTTWTLRAEEGGRSYSVVILGGMG